MLIFFYCGFILIESYRNLLGYLPQDFGYYPEFSAFKFMLYMSAVKRLSRAYARQRSLELLETVGLLEVNDKKVKTFSGGMKQRLGIAQAMLNDPKILILAEPTAGLDPKERVKFRNLISSFAADKIVLLSTHIVSDVEYIAGGILVMKKGTLVHTGRTEEILGEGLGVQGVLKSGGTAVPVPECGKLKDRREGDRAARCLRHPSRARGQGDGAQSGGSVPVLLQR